MYKNTFSYFRTLFLKEDYLLCIQQIQAFLKNKITINRDEDFAKILNILALCYQLTNDYENAVYYLNEALKIDLIYNNDSVTANHYNNLSGVYIEMQDYHKAIHFIHLAIKHREKAKDYKGLVNEYLQASTLFLFIEDLEEAKSCLEKGKKICKIHKLDDRFFNVHFIEGRILKRLEKFSDAIASYTTSFKIAKKLNIHYASLKSLESIAECYIKDGNYKNALLYSSKAMSLAIKFNFNNLYSKEMLLNSLFNLGELEKCKPIIEEFLRVIKDNKEHQLTIFHLASQYYFATNQPVLAYEYSQKHLEAYKKYYNTTINQKVIQLQAQFESERKDNQLQQLKWKQAEAELKALRSQLNPHFIFNTLSLFRNEMRKGNIQKADELLVSFSRLLRLVLDSSRHTATPISSTIQLVQVYLELENARSPNPVQLVFNIAPSLRKSSLPLSPLFIQPIVENAIIHGLNSLKKRKPVLLIEIIKKKSVWHITIEDNGIGRKAAAKYSNSQKPSHATAMIQESLEILCESKNATPFFVITDLKDENKKPAGTKVQIQIPF